MKTTIWTYMRDVVDEGPEECLKTIRERAGVSGISVVATYHAGSFVLPHNPRRKIWFPEDGALYFQPDLKLYGSIKPHISNIVDECDPLRTMEEAAGTQKMMVTAWTVLLHNSTLGSLYPEYTSRNVFGDHLIFALCPSAEASREYAVALVRDLTNNHELETIELETFEFMGYRHGYHHEMAGVEITPIADFLLSLCFCESCRERAEDGGGDFDVIREAARARLEKFFERAEVQKPLMEEVLELDNITGGGLKAYLKVRMRTVQSLLAEIKSAADGRASLRPILEHPPEISPLFGIDLNRLNEIASEVTVLAYKAGIEETIEYAERYRAALPKNLQITVGLHGGEPYMDGPENFAGKIKGLKAAGFESLSFYNYGFMRLENLDWIREALRG
ncbi:hypothetical protein ACFLT7_05820 [candidate division KSB1 bacterium]